MKKSVLFAALFIVLLSVGFDVILTAQESVPAEETEQVTQVTGIQSFWELTKYAREFRWPLFATFIMGVILSVKKTVDLVFEWKHGVRFYRTPFHQYSDLDQLEHFARKSRSIASDLTLHLLQSLKTDPDAGKFTEEFQKFAEVQKQNFSTFQKRMAFWSDTAGALGLLGTVWGMFVTFFRGTMEQQEILSGMGLALITTLIGLVISIILNFLATEVGSFFNRILKKLSQIADKLWGWVIYLEPAKTEGSNPAITRPTGIKTNDRSIGMSAISNERENRKSASLLYEIHELSGSGFKTTVNRRLKDSLSIRLIKIENGRKKKAAGESVLFYVSDNMGTFHNGKNKVSVETNNAGKAEAYFTTGPVPGLCRVGVKHEESSAKPVFFDIVIQGAKPADLKIVSGNHQSGKIGEILSESLIVQVMDDAGHPVPGVTVRFSVDIGNGSFSNNKSDIETRTNTRGLAQIEVQLGKKPGFHSFQAIVSELPGKQVSFEAMGKS